MNQQLAWIAALLAERGVPNWADTGTLLGLVREGDVLAHDGDIDISVWAEHLPALTAALGPCRAAGYRVHTFVYGRQVCKIKLVPSGAVDGALTIDFKIWRRHDGHAWCPFLWYRQPPSRLGRNVAQGARRLLLAACSRHTLTRAPWSHLLHVRTWWIPLALVTKLEPWRGTAVTIPAAAEACLALHYGDWHKPHLDWHSDTDDGAQRHEPPSALVPGALG